MPRQSLDEKPYVLLVILVFVDCFLPKPLVLLVIPVFFDCFYSQTICFTCHSCDLRVSEAFLLENILESLFDNPLESISKKSS